MFSVSGTPGAQAAPTRVLVVDDHELFRIGLRRLLEDEGFSVSDADTARAATRRSADPAPDVVVVGANRPAGCDCEAIRSTREAAPSAAVLVLALVLDEAHILRAARAGYVLKDAELPHIVAAIRDAASGAEHPVPSGHPISCHRRWATRGRMKWQARSGPWAGWNVRGGGEGRARLD